MDTIGSYSKRLLSLWSSVVFEKEVIFHEFDFETSELEFEVPKSSIWKLTTSCDKGVFSTTNELKFSQVCYIVQMLGYTKKTGLWQLPIVSSVFKQTNLLTIIVC